MVVPSPPRMVALVDSSAATSAVLATAEALIPLDGTAATAEAVENLVGLFADSGIEVVPLHVLGPATMPHYWDQPAHEPEVWGTEFLRRLWHAPRAPLQLRSGAVGPQILDAAQVLDIDLIVLAWTQHLDPGRSRVLRDVIAASTVPVLVVPIRQLDV